MLFYCDVSDVYSGVVQCSLAVSLSATSYSGIVNYLSIHDCDVSPGCDDVLVLNDGKRRWGF